MRLPRLRHADSPPKPIGSPSPVATIRPQVGPSDPEYYDNEEQCICVHAADSAAMGWGPTSRDQEGDAFFRQRMEDFCGIPGRDILVDRGQRGQPYYIKLDDRRCYVYEDGRVVCGDARHSKGRHGMMNDPETIDCTAKHQQFYDDVGGRTEYERP